MAGAAGWQGTQLLCLAWAFLGAALLIWVLTQELMHC
jgi:hypothetical protein